MSKHTPGPWEAGHYSSNGCRMSEAMHTPLPWYSNRKHEIGPRVQSDDQSDGMMQAIADVYGDNREADISLILASVNERPALLARVAELEAALRRSKIDLEASRELVRQTMGEPHGLNQTIEIIYAALSTTERGGS